MATQDFTDDQRKAMLEGVHKREGKWDNVSIESELKEIGRTVGLDEENAAQLFKQLMDEHYIDPGRILQAGGLVEPKPKGEAVDYGGLLIHIGYDIKLTDRGRAYIGV